MKTENRYCGLCNNEQEFQILNGDEFAELRGSSHAVLWGSSHAELRGSSHAELWGSSHAVLRESSHAELWGSSHAELWESSHAVLWGSSHAVLRESSRAELWGSSHAELWGSSHAELRESSHAVLRESSHAVLSKFACAHIYGKKVKCDGGIQIRVPEISTPKEWCDFYGVKIEENRTVTLFKATDENYSTSNGVTYQPGTMPQAPDWDGGKAECGGGLHFAFHPLVALRFKLDAKKFVACPVRLDDIVVHKNAQYPDKIKAKGVCAPVWEVDKEGKRID